MSIEIRAFRPNEAPLYRAIRLRALQTNPEAFGSSADDFVGKPLDEIRERLQADFDDEEALVLGAFADGVPVGMMGFKRLTHRKRRHKGFIWGVFVDPEWRRYGIAGRLLQRIIEFAVELPGVEQVTLSVVQENSAAIRFYKSRGFATYGIEPNAMKADGVYYDEIMMVKFLDGIG